MPCGGFRPRALRKCFVTQTIANPTETSSPASPTGAAVQLNAFQLLMHRWGQLGAYNAGQVMQVSGDADAARWQSAIEATIQELGLGIPHFGPALEEVRFSPVPAIPVEAVTTDFETYINHELNRPFAPTELPIRFAVLARTDDTHYLGAFYDHWIADSRAMRELMRRIFARYQHPGAAIALPRLTLAAPPFRALFGRHLGWSRLWAMARESLRNMRRHTYAYRINLIDPLNFESRCLYVALPPGLIQKLHARAKAQHASVNDAFLAVLGHVMGNFTAGLRYAGKRRHGRRRDQVSLGTIVDIRDAATVPLDNVFGLYLSNYTTILTHPEKQPLPTLFEQIGRATRRVKASFGSVRATASMEMARYCWDRFGTPRQKSKMFVNHVPVTAGTSNVNLTGSWIDQPLVPGGHVPTVLDYIRISPTGPLLPLAFTLTTIRESLSLCMTYRTTAFTPAQGQELMERFIQGLQDAVA